MGSTCCCCWKSAKVQAAQAIPGDTSRARIPITVVSARSDQEAKIDASTRLNNYRPPKLNSPPKSGKMLNSSMFESVASPLKSEILQKHSFKASVDSELRQPGMLRDTMYPGVNSVKIIHAVSARKPEKPVKTESVKEVTLLNPRVQLLAVAHKHETHSNSEFVIKLKGESPALSNSSHGRNQQLCNTKMAPNSMGHFTSKPHSNQGSNSGEYKYPVGQSPPSSNSKQHQRPIIRIDHAQLETPIEAPKNEPFYFGRKYEKTSKKAPPLIPGDGHSDVFSKYEGEQYSDCSEQQSYSISESALRIPNISTAPIKRASRFKIPMKVVQELQKNRDLDEVDEGCFQKQTTVGSSPRNRARQSFFRQSSNVPPELDSPLSRYLSPDIKSKNRKFDLPALIDNRAETRLQSDKTLKKGFVGFEDRHNNSARQDRITPSTSDSGFVKLRPSQFSKSPPPPPPPQQEASFVIISEESCGLSMSELHPNQLLS